MATVQYVRDDLGESSHVVLKLIDAENESFGIPAEFLEHIELS